MTDARFRQLVAMVEERENLQRAGRITPAIKLQHGELRELLAWYKREPLKPKPVKTSLPGRGE